MKQILQAMRSGETLLADVPSPGPKPGHALIQTRASLISAGTERMLVEFGKAGYLQKARQQPEKVRQVLNKIRTDGFMPTFTAVRSKLDQPIPLGYCNVGVVVDNPGSGIQGWELSVGDRMVSNGQHAEVVRAPRNLCVGVPDNVSDKEAAFTVIGAIALQGARLAQPTLGEAFVVTGLGLVGQLAAQILIAHGCGVLGIDFDSEKCELARGFGVKTVDLSKGQDPIEAAMAFSKNRGLDGVLITAATKSSEPVHQAAEMCRKRGRIVLVGVTGLELNRMDFYEKEISFQVSCSYGPGRYDIEYEEKGHDYPIGFVRWTEQRNFEAVLELMASGKIDVAPLISHEFDIDDAVKAYDMITENKEPYLGIILNYPQPTAPISRIPEKERTISLKKKRKLGVGRRERAVIGLIGAGNFTGNVLLPALKNTGARLKTIASGAGVSGTHLGGKFGFDESTTEAETIFSDPEICTVFITTRHDSHARFVLKALGAGKNVFVEKPLCLNSLELEEIKARYASMVNARHSPQPLFMVGFNRRFSPHVVKMKQLLNSMETPKSIIYTANAGFIPADSWVQDPAVGGGRIIGEACHFIDLLRFLTGARLVDGTIKKLKSGVGDTAAMQFVFGDGSIGAIHYFANGNKSFPKERLEVFVGQKILQLDNFKVLRGYGWKHFKKMKPWSQDKGHAAGVNAFIDAVIEGGPSPIPFEEIIEVMETTIRLASDG